MINQISLLKYKGAISIYCWIRHRA